MNDGTNGWMEKASGRPLLYKMFSITLSHFERFFQHDGCNIIILGESIFIFSFVVMDWQQSPLGWLHI